MAEQKGLDHVDWDPGFQVRLILAWRRARRIWLGWRYRITTYCPECHMHRPRTKRKRMVPVHWGSDKLHEGHFHKMSCYFVNRKSWG